jgi:hypothetical protein
MDTNQIRIQLLRQHAELRALIGQVRAAIGAPAMRGPKDDDDLVEKVDALAGALQAHNACEERLLEGILSTVDAWGPVRAEIMNERHVAEHKELHAELVDPSLDTKSVSRVLDRLLEHIEYEEQSFLNEEVLREDCVVIDASGG